MKKFLVTLLLIAGITVFAETPIFVSHYQNDAGDTLMASISPLDGNLYVIINNTYQVIFYPKGKDAKYYYWGSPSFGTMTFSKDCKLLIVQEYSSGMVMTFVLTGVHEEYLP